MFDSLYGTKEDHKFCIHAFDIHWHNFDPSFLLYGVLVFPPCVCRGSKWPKVLGRVEKNPLALLRTV